MLPDGEPIVRRRMRGLRTGEKRRRTATINRQSAQMEKQLATIKGYKTISRLAPTDDNNQPDKKTKIEIQSL